MGFAALAVGRIAGAGGPSSDLSPVPVGPKPCAVVVAQQFATRQDVPVGEAFEVIVNLQNVGCVAVGPIRVVPDLADRGSFQRAAERVRIGPMSVPVGESRIMFYSLRTLRKGSAVLPQPKLWPPDRAVLVTTGGTGSVDVVGGWWWEVRSWLWPGALWALLALLRPAAGFVAKTKFPGFQAICRQARLIRHASDAVIGSQGRDIDKVRGLASVLAGAPNEVAKSLAVNGDFILERCTGLESLLRDRREAVAVSEARSLLLDLRRLSRRLRWQARLGWFVS